MQRRRTIPRQPPSESDEPDQPSESVSLGSPPEGDLPDLPRDLTELSDRDLMILFSEFVQWQNFAASRLGLAEVEERRAEAALKWAEDLIMMGAVKGEIVKTRHTLSQDTDVAAARERALQAYAVRKTTAVVFDNCERSANLVSRELSRRQSINPTERRSNRWNP